MNTALTTQQKREAYLKCLDILVKLYFSGQMTKAQYEQASKDIRPL